MIKESSDITLLQTTANEIRKSIIQSLSEAGSGHLGGSLGLADVFTSLYFAVMNNNPLEPEWVGRDKLILSIGHVAPVLYATLAQRGYFPLSELNSLRKLGSRLQGHPARNHKLPGIELSAGSLGQGLSVAVGMALAHSIDNNSAKIYCVMGDGELQEGSVWEAAMCASHYKLKNLIGIVDRNHLQIDGNTATVMEIEPLHHKWESFGWEVFQCNGNDITDLLNTFKKLNSSWDRPKLIIASTLMGKGIPEIENNNQWHGKAPTKEQARDFISMLNTQSNS